MGMRGDDEAPAVKTAYTTDGVHLLRTAQQVQYQLSQMADQKASMLLGITFVIFTLAVGQMRMAQPQVPLLILGGAAFGAAVLAVLAVLPAVKAPPRPEGPANILFFGSFAQLREEEYVARLVEIVADHRTIYEAFAHDIYQNGRVLAFKKYKLIGYAYRVLLVGLIGSLVAFLVQFAMHGLKL
jgi:hypothetical protein